MPLARPPSVGWYYDEEQTLRWTGDESTESLKLYSAGSEPLYASNDPQSLPIDTLADSYDQVRAAYDLVPAPAYAYAAAIFADMIGDKLAAKNDPEAELWYAEKQDMSCAAAWAEAKPGGRSLSDFWQGKVGERTVDSMNTLGFAWGALPPSSQERAAAFCPYDPTMGTTIFADPGSSLRGLSAGALQMDPTLTAPLTYVNTAKLQGAAGESSTQPPVKQSRALAWGAVGLVAAIGVGLIYKGTR